MTIPRFILKVPPRYQEYDRLCKFLDKTPGKTVLVDSDDWDRLEKRNSCPIPNMQVVEYFSEKGDPKGTTRVSLERLGSYMDSTVGGSGSR